MSDALAAPLHVGAEAAPQGLDGAGHYLKGELAAKQCTNTEVRMEASTLKEVALKSHSGLIFNSDHVKNLKRPSLGLGGIPSSLQRIEGPSLSWLRNLPIPP